MQRTRPGPIVQAHSSEQVLVLALATLAENLGGWEAASLKQLGALGQCIQIQA